MDKDADGFIVLTPNDEMSIRPPAQTALALGILLALHEENEDIIGYTREELLETQRLLIGSLSRAHVANEGTWGSCWQCAHWSFFTGFGAWLVWNELPPDTQQHTAHMIEFEANRFLGEPHYCNDCTDDSRAEDTAWNANIIALAAAMMPHHPQHDAWQEASSQWMLAAFAKPSDMHDGTKVDGTRVMHWIDGWNIREAGYLYNHDRIHPDYMAAAHMNLWNPLVAFLARDSMQEAAFWNMNLLYNNLENYQWRTPEYDAPGGTIYQDGKAEVYYPQGTGWSTALVDNFFLFDVQAAAFNIDAGVETPAREWAHVRADHLLTMQERDNTGQLYQPEDKLHFYPKESKAAAWFALSHLTLWLEQQDAWTKALP